MFKVYTLLKNGFEEVEALTVVDFLRRAEINTYTVSLENDLLVKGSHSISVQADILFDDLQFNDIDVLFIPGGMPAARDISNDERVLDLIAKLDKQGKVLASICAGPLALSKAGALVGKKATSFPGYEDDLIGISEYIEDKPFIRDENVITSRSVSTANLLALELIGLIKGNEKKEEIRRQVLLDLFG